MRVGQQLRVVHRHRRGPGELGSQLHGVLGERVAAFGIGIDRADHLIADDQRQRQRGVHAHPGYPATEVRPTAVTAQRSAHCGSPRLHAGDAWPLVQFVVLNRVDLVDKYRRRRPGLDAGYAVLRVDQCDARAVGAGNRLGRELRHVAGAGRSRLGRRPQSRPPRAAPHTVRPRLLPVGWGRVRAVAALCDRAGRRSRPTCPPRVAPLTTNKFTLCRASEESVDERQRVGAPQLARRRLGDHSRLEHHHVAGPDIDLGNHLVGHLLLDAAHLGGILPAVATPPRRRTSPARVPRPGAPPRHSPAGPRRRGRRRVRCRSGRCCGRP